MRFLFPIFGRIKLVKRYKDSWLANLDLASHWPMVACQSKSWHLNPVKLPAISVLAHSDIPTFNQARSRCQIFGSKIFEIKKKHKNIWTYWKYFSYSARWWYIVLVVWTSASSWLSGAGNDSLDLWLGHKLIINTLQPSHTITITGFPDLERHQTLNTI